MQVFEAICILRLTRDYGRVAGESPVACKIWLSRGIFNMYRYARNMVEQEARSYESAPCIGCLSRIRPSNTNDSLAAKAVIQKVERFCKMEKGRMQFVTDRSPIVLFVVFRVSYFLN